MWRSQVLRALPNIELSIIMGQYAQNYHLAKTNASLTDSVKSWLRNPNNLVPLPHPSPRNNMWLKRNPWFESEMIPLLQIQIEKIMNAV